jgi:AraC-like DNA-binding protein
MLGVRYTSLRVRPHSPGLIPFVRSIAYNETELPSGLERTMPTGGVALMLNLHEDEFRTYQGQDYSDVRRTSGAILSGPHTRATVIDSAEMRCNVSVMFETGGALQFFGVPMSDVCNSLVPLDELIARFGIELRERVLNAPLPMQKLRIVEEVLLERLTGTQTEPSITLAASALAEGALVSDVTERVGMPPKRFVRNFRSQIGLTPKRWARVHRLQRLLRSVRSQSSVDWGAAAVEHGFYDQSHLINDFRQLTGITPTAYEARSAEAHNHVRIPG